MGRGRKKKSPDLPVIPAAAEELADRVLEEDRLSSTPMRTLVCSFCYTPMWQISQENLEKLNATPETLEPVPGMHEKVRKESVQLDCSVCGEDVFEINSAGGFRAYVEDEKGKVTRYPSGSRVPGFSIRRSHYIDPNGSMQEIRDRMAESYANSVFVGTTKITG